MFGIFKKRANRAMSEIKKFDKRDLAEAVVNAAYLIAYADVKGDQRECEDVLDVAVAIARADGEIEAAEEAMLKQIAEALGLRYDA